MQSLIAVRARSYGRDVDARRAISRPVDSPAIKQVFRLFSFFVLNTIMVHTRSIE